MENEMTSPTNTNAPKARIGGHVLVDQLVINGCDRAFGVPGESYLAVLDGFYERRDATQFVICRHEGGAANMAEAYGKMTGKPGICFVTRGPGACNAAIGIHTAHQDSTPMILFIGQVGSDFVDREAFQEVDYRKMFAPLCKWVSQIDRADRIPEYISHAYHVAMSGRPGPVVLALPEDMLTTLVSVHDVPAAQKVITYPGAEQMAQLRAMLEAAQRPVAILGGFGWDVASCNAIEQFIEAWDLPTGCAFRFQDLLDNAHPNYVGDVGIGINPALSKRIKESDLVLAIGPRLGEMTTSGYTLFDAPRPKQKMVHVHAGADELGRVYQADLLINATPSAFAHAAALLPPPGGEGRGEGVSLQRKSRQSQVTQAHAEFLEWSTPKRRTPEGVTDLAEIVGTLNKHLPPDAILTNGAGNYAAFLHRYYRYGGFRSQLAPTSGAMGYGVPAAIAAKIIDPKRTVVSWNGDGCFQMHGLEIGTAMQYGANVIFVVVNNGTYGTIRMHQERDYPARISGTDIHNPNFAELAKSFGANGVQTRTLAEFEAAMQAALKANKASLIEVIVDAEYISPRATITQLRATNK
jgi:acetolactate synthase I/II/III large subunit